VLAATGLVEFAVVVMRVLILSQRLPYAPNRGDRVRVFHMMREVAAHAEIDVAALVHDDDEAAHAADLRGLAGEVVTARIPRLWNHARSVPALLGPTPLTHVLLDSPDMVPALTSLVERRRPDVLLTFCSSMARFAVQPPLSQIPCVLDMIDADSAKWTALADTTTIPLRWVYRREARQLSGFETVAMRRAFTTLVVNEKERSALHALAPETSIRVIENGVDLESFVPQRGPQESASVVFCGVMNYAPNVQGAVWLAQQVWPIVRATRPDARLLLIGASPSPDVTALANKERDVVVTGTVDDVRPYLWDAAVAAAPLHVARGVQNKVLEAVAAGLPCVVTPQVAEGLPGEISPACRTGANPQAFAEQVLDLLGRSAFERRAIAGRANLESVRWKTRLQPLMPLLEAAAREK
jgi:polysaccharide biosynthesis protein PslH